MADDTVDSLSEARRIEALRAQQALIQQKWEEQIRIEEAAEAERVKQKRAYTPEKTFYQGPLTWLFRKSLSLIAVISPIIASIYMIIDFDNNERGLVYVLAFWLLGICAIPFAWAFNIIEESTYQAKHSIRSSSALTERFSAIYGLKIFVSTVSLSFLSILYYKFTGDNSSFYSIILFSLIFGTNYMIVNFRKNRNKFGNNFEEANELIDFLYAIRNENDRSGINRVNPAYIENISSSAIHNAVYVGHKNNVDR